MWSIFLTIPGITSHELGRYCVRSEAEHTAAKLRRWMSHLKVTDVFMEREEHEAYQPKKRA